MATRKDKKQVIGEPMTDDQVRRFLAGGAPAGVDADFHALERAYRGLRAHDFARFLDFFAAEGRRLDATNPLGQTIDEALAGHANAADYREALAAHRAEN